MNLNQIKNLIANMENILTQLKAAIEEPVQQIEPIQPNIDKLKSLLNDPLWPAAVDPSLICDEASEEDKTSRANDVLNIIIERNLQDVKFLDYGCGEGHMAVKSKDLGTSLSVGYDIKTSTNFIWETQQEKVLLTTDFVKVANAGPIDVILLYDVLDHLENETAIEVLTKLKTILTRNGSIYLRCHPFCSRHGNHLYREINKAFIGLVFTHKELEDMGYNPMKTERILFPGKTYNEYISKSGLTIVKTNVDRDTVEPFFLKNEDIKAKILSSWDRGINEEFPAFQMEQSFVDYELKH